MSANIAILIMICSVVAFVGCAILVAVIASRAYQRNLERLGKPHGMDDKSKVGETLSFDISGFTVKVGLCKPIEGSLECGLLTLKYFGMVTVLYPAEWEDITAVPVNGLHSFNVTAHLKDGRHSQGQLSLTRRDGDIEHCVYPASGTFINWKRAKPDSKEAAPIKA